jgi:hypothetical protein
MWREGRRRGRDVRSDQWETWWITVAVRNAGVVEGVEKVVEEILQPL